MKHQTKPAQQALFINSVKRIQGKAELALSDGSIVVMPRAMLNERPYRSGMPFDPEVHQSFIHSRAYAFALNKAVSLLSLRARTEREIVDTLEQASYSDEVIARVMARLQEANYINDSDFAEQWAATRTTKGLGKIRIKMELRHKGINSDTIDHALSSIDDPAMFDSAVKAARKAAHGKDLTAPADRQKLIAALARRGFDYPLAKQAMQHIIDEEAFY